MDILPENTGSSNGTPLPLAPGHLAKCRSSGLSDETIRANRLATVSDPDQINKILGWKRGGERLGQCLRFRFSDDYSRLRPSTPRTDKKENKSVKYESPKGKSNRAYVPAGIEATLADPSAPLAVTEGELKSLCLSQNGIPTIGLTGVYGWQVKRERDDEGKPTGERKLISDLEAIKWDGRLVFIVFDSDAATNDNVRYAEKHLAEALTTKGATVRIVRIPPGQAGAKIGADDYIVAHGPDAMRQLLLKADGAATATKKRKESDATKLANGIKQSAELFHDEDSEAYVTFEFNGHRETHLLKSKAGRQFLRRFFYCKFGRNIGSQAFQDAVGLVESMAVFDGREHRVYTRVAECEHGIIIDLADAKWQCVIITESGYRVTQDCPAKFRRPASMKPLPVPEPGSIDDLRPYVNLASEDDWKLLVAWILAAFWPRGPYPILCLHGEQGSAKSTAAKLLKLLIDPNKSNNRKSPRDEEDLVIAAANSQLVAYDNLSHLQDWQSDAHCRLATGGGIGKRMLFTDGDEFILDVVRPQILNGIEDLATRGDLQERCITLNLPPIPEDRRQTERELLARFEKDRPKILGGIFRVLGDAKKRLPSVKLTSMPRMADFCELVTAAEPALGWTPGEFLSIYLENAADANSVTLDSALIAAPLRSILPFDGTYSELLDRLENAADQKLTKKKGWPANARSVAAAVKRLAPALRKAGITVEPYRGPKPKRERRISLTQEGTGNFASPSSPPSPNAENTGFFAADGGTQNRRGDDGGTQTQSPTNPLKTAGGTMADGGTQICATFLTASQETTQSSRSTTIWRFEP